MGLIRKFQKDRLDVSVFENRLEMGKAAAADIANQINALLKQKSFANVVFAAAPSQNEMLEELCRQKVNWKKVNAFHMDEYIGLERNAPQSFEFFLREHIFERLPFRNVYYISEYGEQYAKLLREYPTDLVCMGIGENGHIAFNDPGEANFFDEKLIKKVVLDEVCRQQQVNDGCFPSLEKVPQYAFSLTVPALFQADHLFCVVPAKTKRQAVTRTVYDPVSEQCPATVLRRHKHAVLYCDRDSGADLLQGEETSCDKNYSALS